MGAKRAGVVWLGIAAVLIGLWGPAVSAAPAAAPSPTVAAAKVGRLGTVLVDGAGRTLYRYTPDRPGRSLCTGECAVAWPPVLQGRGGLVLARGLTGKLGTVVRSDRTRQVTYNGIPLYRFAGDARKGQANGQGLGRVWYVVKPGERLVAAPATTTTRPPTTLAPARTTTTTTTAPLGAGSGDTPDYGYVY